MYLAKYLTAVKGAILARKLTIASFSSLSPHRSPETTRIKPKHVFHRRINLFGLS